MKHECIVEFGTEKKYNCSGKGYNICQGTGPMYLKVWYEGTDGMEESYDAFRTIIVNYCPYCGLKSFKDYENI